MATPEEIKVNRSTGPTVHAYLGSTILASYPGPPFNFARGKETHRQGTVIQPQAWTQGYTQAGHGHTASGLDARLHTGRARSYSLRLEHKARVNKGPPASIAPAYVKNMPS